MPAYDGSKDPIIWLHHCEKFLSNQSTANQEKVGLISCFSHGNCAGPYFQGHLCKKSFWLEREHRESEDIPTDSGEPTISLHAITGKEHANTMQ